MGSISSPQPEDGYTLLDQYHSKPRPLRVIAAGAGAGGVLLAYRMQKSMTNFDLLIYEKNGGIGGTWFENRYPGVACDIPAHVYTYPFEQNPEFSHLYSSGFEIKKYFENFAAKHDLLKYMTFETKVIRAVWDNARGIYNITLDQNGKIFSDWCHIFVNGTGFLNNWRWPAIDGLHSFKGILQHSANFDTSTNFEGKRVGVIGTGSSAIQAVPVIQKQASHVVAFMRSETWISPAYGDLIKNLVPDGGVSAISLTDNAYSEETKEMFRQKPETLLTHRKQMETLVNSSSGMFKRGSETSIAIEKLMRDEMLRRIGPGNDLLKEKLIPKWSPGCRRLTPGDGYLEALVKPNVTTIFSEIEKIVPNGVLDADGVLHELDVLLCATGFNPAFTPPFEIIGNSGVSIKDEWTPNPKCYLGLAAPKFPNLFIINGPRGNWANGCVLPCHDVQISYMVTFMKRMQEEGIKSVEVDGKVTDDLNQQMDAWFRTSVFTDNRCRSWYKGNTYDGKPQHWAGSLLHYLKTIKDPKYEHYKFQYIHDNIFAYLGNGVTEAEANRDVSKLAPYIRMADEPWEI